MNRKQEFICPNKESCEVKECRHKIPHKEHDSYCPLADIKCIPVSESKKEKCLEKGDNFHDILCKLHCEIGICLTCDIENGCEDIRKSMKRLYKVILKTVNEFWCRDCNRDICPDSKCFHRLNDLEQKIEEMCK